MATVFPSEVREYVVRSWSKETAQAPGPEYVDSSQLTPCSGLVALVDRVPAPLLAVLTSGEHAAYQAAVSALRDGVTSWLYPAPFAVQPKISRLKAFGNRHPITIIAEALAKCPDQAPAGDTPGLEFLEDPVLSASLRQDMSEANAALESGSFKSAVVLAGSVVEAVLYWALSRLDETARAAAIAAWNDQLELAGQKKKSWKPDMVYWTLQPFVWVARYSGILTQETTQVADSAKSFRNLIHAEASVRRQLRVSQPMSRAAVAGMQLVVADVEKWSQTLPPAAAAGMPHAEDT